MHCFPQQGNIKILMTAANKIKQFSLAGTHIYMYGQIKLLMVHVINLLIFVQGVNLNSACESGQVTFLDGLKLVSDSLDDDDDDYEDNNASDDTNPFRNLRYIFSVFQTFHHLLVLQTMQKITSWLAFQLVIGILLYEIRATH